MEVAGAILVLVIGCVLAFPAAVLICAALGWLIQVIGIRCPRCQRRKLECYWSECSDPPTPQFYHCTHCGAHLRRWFNGPWEDTHGPEHDEFARLFWLAYQEMQNASTARSPNAGTIGS